MNKFGIKVYYDLNDDLNSINHENLYFNGKLKYKFRLINKITFGIILRIEKNKLYE